jgi:prepilin-type N-terminal cleavage/methylation domain-containing protein
MRQAQGFTLVEVVIALTILAFGIIATIPMFVYAAKENAGAGDRGMVGTLAVDRMEDLRGGLYYSLGNGGSLTSNVTGYSDTSNLDYDVRWTVASNPNPPTESKVVVVRAVAKRQVIGQPKSVTIVTLRVE